MLTFLVQSRHYRLPTDASTHQLRGALRNLLKDKSGAIADLRAAAKLYQPQEKNENYKKVMAELERMGS